MSGWRVATHAPRPEHYAGLNPAPPLNAYVDRKGRVWYAASLADLPSDPTAIEKIPECYWPPDPRMASG